MTSLYLFCNLYVTKRTFFLIYVGFYVGPSTNYMTVSYAIITQPLDSGPI